MIYFLKFCASFVLPPGIFIVIFLILALKLRRRGETRIAAYLAATAAALWLLSTALVSDWLMRSLETAYIPPKNPSGDVIIALGGGATKDTPDVNGTGGLTSSPANRLLTAARLHRLLRIPIIVSGGQVYADSGPEAEISRRVLMGLGVDEADIITETESRTTGENAVCSARLMLGQGFSRPILVTSAFHMRRAVLNFSRAGVSVVPYPADYQANLHERDFHYTRLRPQPDALSASACVMQERLRTLVTELTGF